MVLRSQRGQGIGRRFFELRLEYARSLPGVSGAVFCEVIREPDHPGRPPDYSKPEPAVAKPGLHAATRGDLPARVEIRRG